jgi:hypothetical protein
VSDVGVSSNLTDLFFLHGALHLWQRDRDAATGKWTNSGRDLLQLRSRYSGYSAQRPLFVSEGSSTAKLQTIRKSDYLSFAYGRRARRCSVGARMFDYEPLLGGTDTDSDHLLRFRL